MKSVDNIYIDKMYKNIVKDFNDEKIKKNWDTDIYTIRTLYLLTNIGKICYF